MQNNITPRRCLLPFSSLTLNTDGSCAPCCKYNLNKTDKDIETETVHTKDIKELFFQPAMENIRQQFLNGIEPVACSACWDEEAAGIKSLRLHREYNATYGDGQKGKYAGKYENPSIMNLDFKFSSLCNLKCRICGPYCSSTWLKESLDTGEYSPHTIKIFSKYAERKIINNEINFNIIKEILPDLNLLEFYGGEPLMQPEHTRILEIIDKSVPESEKLQTRVYYNTNCTIYDEYAVNVWNKIKYVELNISIDDIGNRFEYQRHPANWDTAMANLSSYRTNVGNNVEIMLYSTISLYNIFYIDEYIKYVAEHIKLPIRFNLLHWPTSMSIIHLPAEIKQIIKAKLSMLTEHELSYITLAHNLDSIINFMSSGNGDDTKIDEFLKTTAVHDNYRLQSFAKTFPEYHQLLIEHKAL